jgi:Putative restriction endonuclease
MAMNFGCRLMTADEVLDWCLEQEERFEFVNGQPRAMTRATQVNDEIVVNVLSTLKQKLKGKPCRPQTANVATRIPAGAVRRPDITVDCGPKQRTS